VLSNALVVIVPTGSKAKVAGPADLAGFAHVALADPDVVPAGVYTRRYLEGLGLWEKVGPRVVPTLDVRAALAAVADEHADAGVVYRTDAAITPKVRIAFEVPRAQGPAIVYPLAPVVASKREDTRAVVRCLVSPAALRVYERYGFIVILGK
jgi:molybdate transport system substrate-binding protein